MGAEQRGVTGDSSPTAQKAIAERQQTLEDKFYEGIKTKPIPMGFRPDNMVGRTEPRNTNKPS